MPARHSLIWHGSGTARKPVDHQTSDAPFGTFALWLPMTMIPVHVQARIGHRAIGHFAAKQSAQTAELRNVDAVLLNQDSKTPCIPLASRDELPVATGATTEGAEHQSSLARAAV